MAREIFVEGVQYTEIGIEEYFIEGVQVNEDQDQAQGDPFLPQSHEFDSRIYFPIPRIAELPFYVNRWELADSELPVIHQLKAQDVKPFLLPRIADLQVPPNDLTIILRSVKPEVTYSHLFNTFTTPVVEVSNLESGIQNKLPLVDVEKPVGNSLHLFDTFIFPVTRVSNLDSGIQNKLPLIFAKPVGTSFHLQQYDCLILLLDLQALIIHK